MSCINTMPKRHANLTRPPFHAQNVCLPVRSVLATSPDDGLIECIPSMALANVIAEHRSIARYLALHSPDPEGARPFRMALAGCHGQA